MVGSIASPLAPPSSVAAAVPRPIVADTGHSLVVGAMLEVVVGAVIVACLRLDVDDPLHLVVLVVADASLHLVHKAMCLRSGAERLTLL